MSNYLPYWVATAYLSLMKPKLFLQLLAQFETIEVLFKADEKILLQSGLSQQHIHELKTINWQLIDEDVRWSRHPDCHLIAYDDPLYPHLLKEICDPPLLLFVRGNVKALSAPQLAMVGTRQATIQGAKHARTFAAALSAAGLVITSGLARGIDAESHQGALSVGGVTIAVLGTGVDYIYPRQNNRLAEAILANQGAIISEFPRATTAYPHHFPKRNRIVTGLSLGVLVVEAALKSGSLISARLAMEAGRDVFAIPGQIHHPLSKGCHALIKQGAKLIESPADIIDELRAFQSIFTSDVTYDTKPACLTELSTFEQHVLKEVRWDATPIDVIILRSGLTAGEVSSILLSLELGGHIESKADGYARISTLSSP